MAEELVITDPVQPPPTTKYRLSSVTYDLEMAIPDPNIPIGTPPPPGVVNIKLKDNNGQYSQYQYIGEKAQTLIKQMNTANMSVKSMQKRLLERLTKDGMIPPATVQGDPEPPLQPLVD